MPASAVKVPASLLLAPEFDEPAKLIWMILRLHAGSGPVRQGQLESFSGLSGPTVRKALARLTATGWGVTAPRTLAAAIDRTPGDRTVSVSGELLGAGGLRARARVLYALLQLSFGQSGQFTYLSLAKLAGAGRKRIKQATDDLVLAGWLKVSQQNQLAPIRFTLTQPGASQLESELAGAQKRLIRAPYRGEALMREYLSLLVAEDQFEDDAAPGFLVNPQTGERMQLDRFYPPSVAFEYNGPQHYGATERFPGEIAAKQQARDFMKVGICVTRGISLVVVTAQDLSLEGMQAKVGLLLPRRDLRGLEPLVAYLERESRRYRRAARRNGFSPRSPSRAEGHQP